MSVGDGLSKGSIDIFIGDVYVHELRGLLGVSIKLSTSFLHY